MGASFVLALIMVAVAGCDSGSEQDAAPPPTSIAQQPASPQSAPKRSASLPHGDGFDFYVLALSWSPSYCAAEGEDANRQQCRSARPHGFVVHGLWPQFERGFPLDCGSGNTDLPRSTVSAMFDLMPSAGLIRHEWRSHGTCSGLSPDDYFKVLRAAREKTVIPAAYAQSTADRAVDPNIVERQFRTINPGLPADGIAVTCDGRYLREVRICMTRSLAFRACPEVDRNACRAARTTMPPVRGG